MIKPAHECAADCRQRNMAIDMILLFVVILKLGCLDGYDYRGADILRRRAHAVSKPPALELQRYLRHKSCVAQDRDAKTIQQ